MFLASRPDVFVTFEIAAAPSNANHLDLMSFFIPHVPKLLKVLLIYYFNYMAMTS